MCCPQWVETPLMSPPDRPWAHSALAAPERPMHSIRLNGTQVVDLGRKPNETIWKASNPRARTREERERDNIRFSWSHGVNWMSDGHIKIRHRCLSYGTPSLDGQRWSMAKQRNRCHCLVDILLLGQHVTTIVLRSRWMVLKHPVKPSPDWLNCSPRVE